MKKENIISQVSVFLGIVFFLYIFSSIRIHDFLFQTQLEEIGILLLFSTIVLIIFILQNRLKQFNFSIIDIILLIALSYYLIIQIVHSTPISSYFVPFLFGVLYLLFKIMNTKYLPCFFVAILIGALIQIFHGMYKLTEPWQDASVINGGFTNSSVFGGFIAFCVILSIELLFCSSPLKKQINIFIKICLFITLVILISQLIYSNSRAGWLSFIVGSLFFIVRKIRIIKLSKKTRIISGSILSLLIISILLFLYSYKKDSADGRLLIWNVSSNIITDFPILGTGTGGFKANYMNYQAHYFQENPKSEYKILADENSYAFNEFIYCGVEYGIIGILLIISIIFTVFAYIPQKLHFSLENIRYKNLLLVLIVLSFFSYPFEFIQFKIIVVMLFALISKNYPSVYQFRPKYNSILPCVLIGVYCLLLYTYTSKLIATKKWDDLLKVTQKIEEKVSEYHVLYKYISDNPRFLYHYGKTLNRSKDYDGAIKVLLEAYNIQPKYIFNIELAEIYIKKRDTKMAQEHLITASYMIPSKFLPDYMMMEMFYKNNDIYSARIYANKIINKPVKILSPRIINMKEEAETIIK